MAASSAFALSHDVDDFRQDFSGRSADTLRVFPAFGDTLSLAVMRQEYRPLGHNLLSDGGSANGAAGTSVMASASGMGRFDFGYVSWISPHTTYSGSIPIADVRIRQASITADSAGFALSSRSIVENEMPGSSGNRAPSHLVFGSQGSRYIAYWSNLDNGKLRRTTDIASSAGGVATGWGSDVLPGAPVSLNAYGALGGSLVPGSDGRQSVVAYVSQLTGASSTIEIRWENFTANTSLTASFNRGGGATAPEELAIASDSSGRTVLLWREASQLYLAAYAANRTVLQAPILVTGIAYTDGSATLHFYRSFDVVALRNGSFQIAYARGNLVYSRHVALSSGASLGAEIGISRVIAGMQASFFPSLSANAAKVGFAWFQRQSASNHRLKAAVFGIQAGLIDTLSRIDVDVANDSIGFTEVPAGWSPYHFFQTASLALDPIGNFGVGYSDGYHAKAALVKYAAIFADSGTFISKPLSVANAAAAFGFTAGSDSVEYRPLQVNATSQVQVKLAFARDSAFAAPADSFRVISAPFRSAGGFFRYRASLRVLDTARLFSSRVYALSVPYNVKPQIPGVDSIRYAASPWRAYNPADTTVLIRRRDSVELRLTGRDLDDGDSLTFAIRLGSKVLATGKSGAKSAAGQFFHKLRFPAPDTLSPSVTLALTTMDGDGWASNAGTALIRLANALPVTAVRATRRRGLDSLGRFYPAKGPVDTLILNPGDTVWTHAGDSLRITASATDANDPNLTLSLKRNGGAAVTRPITSGSGASFSAAPPSAPGSHEAWLLQTVDPDTAMDFRFVLSVNTPPVLDSVWVAHYRLRDGSRKVGGSALKDFASAAGLVVPALSSATLKAMARDRDVAVGKPVEKVDYRLQLWRRSADCEPGDRSCVSITTQASADSLAVTVQEGDDQLSIRATDARGAFLETVIKLTYALADTGSGQDFRAKVMLLDSALDFIMLSGTMEKTVSATLSSRGSMPLQLLSAATSRNHADHLELTLLWRDSSGEDQSIGFPRGTHQNPLADIPANVPPGEDLTLEFRFFTENLRGDTVIQDTLTLRTNDLSAPILSLPFRLIHRELPRLTRLGTLELDTMPKGGNPKGTPALPLALGLRLAFSEPVLVPASGFITVYSLLDSLANPKGYKPIPGRITMLKAKALGKRASQAYALALQEARAKIGAAADSLVDTVIFTPAYAQASDSLKAKPLAGRFLHRDILRIRLSNAPTDPMGNALDLRQDRKLRAAGSLDTVFTLRTDTTVLRLIASQPAQGDSGVDPDAGWRLVFNRPLALEDPPSWTGLSKVDLENLNGDGNGSFRVTSTGTHGLPLHFSSLALESGNTVLRIKMRERPTAFDTVTVTLSGSLSDSDGNTLDGDGDGFPDYLYSAMAGADDMELTFATGEAGFYVFPNPFRFDNPRHAAKGAVTFKNLNVLPGWKQEQALNIRIHDMTGNLVWSDADALSAGNRRGRALADWDLRNSRGKQVATNVYVYTVVDQNDRLLIKGKVAVIH